MTTSENQRIIQWPGFPGGRARLPRITAPETSADESSSAAETSAGEDAPPSGGVRYVDDTFIRRDIDTLDGAPPNAGAEDPEGGFEAYFSSESLFTIDPAFAKEPDPHEGPYAVLGLRASASWEDISRVHRELVSTLHPDRYVGAEDDVRAAAECRVRDVNEAYATIRRERAGRRG